MPVINPHIRPQGELLPITKVSGSISLQTVYIIAPAAKPKDAEIRAGETRPSFWPTTEPKTIGNPARAVAVKDLNALKPDNLNAVAIAMPSGML